MKYDTPIQRDSEFRFAARATTVGYVGLAALLALFAASLLWHWSDQWEVLVAPWTGTWRVHEAVGYAVLVAMLGGFFAIAGGLVGDRGRRYEIGVDTDRRQVRVEEWWRKLTIDFELPLSFVQSFEVHRCVGDDALWQLGALWRNGSYWQLCQSRDAQQLRSIAEALNRDLDDEDGDRRSLDWERERIEVDEDDDGLRLQWASPLQPLSRGLMLVATAILSVAPVLPVLLVSQARPVGLAAATAVGGLFVGATIAGATRGVYRWLWAGGWLAVCIVAIVVFEGHWLLVALATVGLGVMGTSAVALARGFGKPESHSLRIDDAGRFYEDGELVESDGQVALAGQFDAAVVNITGRRPPELLLLDAGQIDDNRRLHLGLEDDPDAGHREPVELELKGLSPFERVGVSLLVDEHLAARPTGDNA